MIRPMGLGAGWSGESPPETATAGVAGTSTSGHLTVLNWGIFGGRPTTLLAASGGAAGDLETGWSCLRCRGCD